jgi:hypothetical protein
VLTPSQAEEALSTSFVYWKKVSPYRERAIEIYERRRRGQHWTDIATAYGVTRERARQIVSEHEEWLAGHIRARDEAEQPRATIVDADAIDLPLTRARLSSSDAKRRRMQRWWLKRYSIEELREMADAIASMLD